MATNVYTFRVTYDGLEDKIWRTIQVSSRYPLDRLGYCVLATFDTLAYHLFSFEYQNQKFSIPSEMDDFFPQTKDMGAVRLENLHLQIGDTLELLYDFGTAQLFHLQLTEISPMEKGKGNCYPHILAGAGCGILDDCPADELAEYIAQIDRFGKTKKKIYYNESRTPWDYRDYALDIDNMVLKRKIQYIEDSYYPYWEK